LSSSGVALIALGRFAKADIALAEAMEISENHDDDLADFQVMCTALSLLAAATASETAGAVPEAAEMLRQAVGHLQSLVDLPEFAEGDVAALLAQSQARLQLADPDPLG